MTVSPNSRPLEGIKILDVTVALAGPFCTLILAGMGAEVIKVEAPGGSDIARTNPPFMGPDGLNFSNQKPGDISTSLLNRNRGKKSITLDLKSKAGRELFRELSKHVDIVVENLSDGTAERLGIGYDEIRKVNPRIIYASISGLGHPNPYPGLKTMDIIVQALSGLMETTGSADGPPTRIGIPIGDLAAPLYALSAITAALFHRERTGVGQRVEVSMLDSLVSLLAAEQFERLEQPGTSLRTGNYYDRFAPFGIYQAVDGYVAICAPANDWAKAVFDAIGRPELFEDDRFSSRGQRMQNSAELNAIIEAWTRKHSVAEITRKMLTERGVPSVPVKDPRDALRDENVRNRGAVVPLTDPRTGREFATGIGVPMRFSECATGHSTVVPALGENNKEIYGDLLKIDPARLSELERQGII